MADPSTRIVIDQCDACGDWVFPFPRDVTGEECTCCEGTYARKLLPSPDEIERAADALLPVSSVRSDA